MKLKELLRNRTSNSHKEPEDTRPLSPQEPAAAPTFPNPMSPVQQYPPYPSSIRASIIAQPSYPNTIRTVPLYGMPAELEEARAFGAYEQQSQYQVHQGPRQHFCGQHQTVYAGQQQRYYDPQQPMEHWHGYDERERQRFYEAQRKNLEEDRHKRANEDRQRKFETEKRQIQAQEERDIEAQQRALAAEAKRKDDERKAIEFAERVSREEKQSLELLMAEQNAQKKQQNASKENVRRLRELIREKYRLDVWIWENRRVQINDRKHVREEYLKSDAITQEIQFIVGAWDDKDFNEEDWGLAKKIKEGLSKVEKQALWDACPPWDPSREDMRDNEEEP